MPNLFIGKDSEGEEQISFVSISSKYLDEVERLFHILDNHKFIEKETKEEINKTIQVYLRQIRDSFAVHEYRLDDCGFPLEVDSKLDSLSVSDMNNEKFMYIILLLDVQAPVHELNFQFKGVETPHFKIQAFGSMTQMVGLRHGSHRPTHIIDTIQDRSHPKFEEWYNSEVMRNAVKADLIKV